VITFAELHQAFGAAPCRSPSSPRPMARCSATPVPASPTRRSIWRRSRPRARRPCWPPCRRSWR
jgi:hypothetical protein